jgi:multiple sugar transport system permease protein
MGQVGGALRRRERARGPNLHVRLGGGALLFTLPSIVLLALFFVYPVAAAIIDSTHGGSVLDSVGGGGFVGGANYTAVIQSQQFPQVVLFSLGFALAAVVGSYVVGLGLALLLEDPLPGRGLFRVLFLLPWVIPAVVSLTSWRWLVGTDAGLADTITRALRLGTVLFLADPRGAVGTVMAVKIWESYPFMYLMMSSGLSGIDPSLYEAAGVDGASRWARVLHITLPSVRTVTWLSCVLMVIFSVNDFTTIWLLTGGGPLNATTNVIVYAYTYVFSQFERGPGDAIAVMTGVLMVVLSAVMMFRLRRNPTAA